MDLEVIDQALHEIQQMVEVSIRAAEGLHGVGDDFAPWRVSQMPRADHELLDFSLIDLARRVKASRAMLFEGHGPVSVKPCFRSCAINPEKSKAAGQYPAASLGLIDLHWRAKGQIKTAVVMTSGFPSPISLRLDAFRCIGAPAP